MQRRRRAAGVHTGADPGEQRMVSAWFCLYSFAYFNIKPVFLSIYIRKNEVSVNLCSIFAFGADLPGF